MAIEILLTEEEFNAQADHINSEAAKALGIEYQKADDGRYVLVGVPKDGFAVENVTGLRNTVEATRMERDDAKKIAESYGGIEPSEIRSALDKAKKFDELDPAAATGKLKAQFEEWKTDFSKTKEEEFRGQLTPVTEERDAYRRQLDATLIEADATTIMAKESIKGNPALVLPLLRPLTDTVLENGKLRVRVINPETGSERVGKTGGAMTMEELLLELRGKEEYASAFGGTGKSGSGTPPEGSGSGTPPKEGLYRSEMSPAEKARYTHEHGRDAFQSIPEKRPGAAQ